MDFPQNTGRDDDWARRVLEEFFPLRDGSMRSDSQLPDSANKTETPEA